MPTFRIRGNIEPRWFQITFDFTPEVKYRIDEADIDLTCSITIDKSDVVASCQTNRFDEEVLSWVLPYVFDWTSAEIDLFSFSAGRALSVNIDRVQWPDGSTHLLAPVAPDLAALATACAVTDRNGAIDVQLRDALQLSVTEPTLMLALRDLGASLRFGNNSIVNCARAVDALKQALSVKDEPSAADQSRAWQHLQETLRVSKDYLKLITDASRGPRHGSSRYISSAVRQEIFHRTWVVMNRFLLYRLKGNKPLAEEEHPSL
jgi:hypothetical protein